MFTGSYDHVLDDKGRSSLPKEFRDSLSELRGTPRLTALRTCLAIFPPDQWEALQAKLSQASSVVDSIQRAQRLILGMAMPCPFDRQGRILIPPKLRDWAQLKREIVFSGLGNRIEIWDRGRHEAELRLLQDENSYAEHMRELKEFGV
jgi:MraZ protein